MSIHDDRSCQPRAKWLKKTQLKFNVIIKIDLPADLLLDDPPVKCHISCFPPQILREFRCSWFHFNRFFMHAKHSLCHNKHCSFHHQRFFVYLPQGYQLNMGLLCQVIDFNLNHFCFKEIVPFWNLPVVITRPFDRFITTLNRKLSAMINLGEIARLYLQEEHFNDKCV